MLSNNNRVTNFNSFRKRSLPYDLKDINIFISNNVKIDTSPNPQNTSKEYIIMSSSLIPNCIHLDVYFRVKLILMDILMF